MPFSNITEDEASHLGNLLRSCAQRLRKRTGGWGGASNSDAAYSSSPSESLSNHDKSEDISEEDENTSTEPGYFNQMAYVDRVVAVLDALQYRHALTQTIPQSITSTEETNTTSGSSTAAAVTECVVREYPFPSLFLNSPRDFVERSWAMGTTATQRREAAVNIRDDHQRPEPPSELLSASAARPHLGRVADRSPSAQAESTKQTPTVMYALDLSRNRQAAARVVVALQAEASLAYSVDYDGHRRHHQRVLANNKSAEADTNASETFLVSPDATTCVIVACRVSLHAVWRACITSYLAQSKYEEDNQKDVSNKDGSDHSSSALKNCRFLALVASTCTAAMVHLDRSNGATEIVSDMLWSGAIPAWLHAVADHSVEVHADSQRLASPPPTPIARVQAALRVIRSTLTSGLSACTAESPDGTANPLPEEQKQHSLLHVEWYLVGGLRDRAHTAPVLTELFKSFFPPRPTSGKNGSKGRRNPDSRHDMLASNVPLSDLVARAGTRTPATTITTADAVETRSRADDRDDALLTIEHRLREDALCMWSFNTAQRNWAVDRNPKSVYNFPMCYGLLLSVTSGAAWPCVFTPGTRAYPIAPIRSLLGDQYHCTFPLEHEKSQMGISARDDDEVAGDALLSSAFSAAPLTVRRQTIRRANALSGLWAAGHEESLPQKAAAKGTAAAAVTDTRSPPEELTLASFTAECLAVLQHQQGIRGTTATQGGTGDVNNSVPSVWAFPLLLRMQLPSLWSRLRRKPGSISAQDVPEQVLLKSSTTPHCEPPDYCAMYKASLVTMEMVGPLDVYTALVGDGKEGAQSEKSIDTDGILLSSTRVSLSMHASSALGQE